MAQVVERTSGQTPSGDESQASQSPAAAPAIGSGLPPGPSWPSIAQTIAWWTRTIPLLERCRRRYGKRFTLRLLASPPVVTIADADEAREVFTAAPEVLHPGEGARVLEPVVGRNSVILLDEGAHMRQRKLMLPAFHGERIEALSGLMTEVAEREVSRWPRGVPTPLHPRLQALTLEIILHAVFGVQEGEVLDQLRSRLAAVLEFGSNPLSLLPPAHISLGGRTAYGRFVRMREQVDATLFAMIDERRASGERGDDVLALLLDAQHEDGSPMNHVELRDELMTLLVAGHETTASELAWVFNRLVSEPRALARVQAAADSDDDAYLTAAVQETMRRRPVIPNAAPRLTMEPMRIGGWDYPAGVCLSPNAYLIHHDPEIYPDPYAFRPERFLDQPPGTYTWIPFGGGRRRCLGASFAMLEMKLVLRAVLSRCEVRAASGVSEVSRRRAITLSPAKGSPTVLVDRDRPIAAAG